MKLKKKNMDLSDRYFLKSFLVRKNPENLYKLDAYLDIDYYWGCAYDLFYGGIVEKPVYLFSGKENDEIYNYIEKSKNSIDFQGILIYCYSLNLIVELVLKYQGIKIIGFGNYLDNDLNANQLFFKGFLLKKYPECSCELKLNNYFKYYHDLCDEALQKGELKGSLEELTNEQKKMIEEYIEKHKDKEKGIDLAEYYLVLKTVIEILKTYYKEDCV